MAGRIYKNFSEGLEEIKRDLKEMGIAIHTRTYQDKYIADDDSMETHELTNYSYTVTEPNLYDLEPTIPWADKEFAERVGYFPVNPGNAYRHRIDVWEQFLEDPYKDPHFSYTYPERLVYEKGNRQIDHALRLLQVDPNSRQAFIAIWDRDDLKRGAGEHRIPCSIGYQLHIRNGKLNLTYLQRSADFATHFVNDIYLAARMQDYLADALGIPVGHYHHWIGSLHVFTKDIEGVF